MNKKPNVKKQSSPIILQKEKKWLAAELDRVVKMMLSRDLALSEIKEKREKEVQELDRIAKMLVRRDFELSRIRERNENNLKELEQRANDLNESKKALMNILEDVEEARRLSEEEKNKTLVLITNFVDGLLVFNEENNFILTNPRAEILLGVRAKDMAGKSVLEFAGVPVFEFLAALLTRKGRGVFRKEIQVKENLIMEVSVVPIISKEKQTETLVILHDITREKMVERMKSEFVSLAAHQLRTPISAIKWVLRMLLDGDLGLLPAVQKDYLEKAYTSNERMISLINDLLNITRLEEGKFLHDVKKEDIAAIAEKTILPLKEMAQRKGLKFIFQKPKGKTAKVNVDAEKISLVIQNLIENAIYYTNSGEVKISLEFIKDENQFLFSVCDTGIGIPEDQQNRIFTKFFRAANALRAKTDGTGLGLFIAKNIIEAHGGKTWLTSKEGKGTTSYFTLPVSNGLTGIPKEF